MQYKHPSYKPFLTTPYGRWSTETLSLEGIAPPVDSNPNFWKLLITPNEFASPSGALQTQSRPTTLPKGVYGLPSQLDQAIRYTQRKQTSRPTFRTRTVGGRSREGKMNMRDPIRYYAAVLPWIVRAGTWAWQNKMTLTALSALLAEMYRARATGAGTVTSSTGGTTLNLGRSDPSVDSPVMRKYLALPADIRMEVDRIIEERLARVIMARQAGIEFDSLEAAQWVDACSEPLIADPFVDAGLNAVNAFKNGVSSEAVLRDNALSSSLKQNLAQGVLKAGLSSVGAAGLASGIGILLTGLNFLLANEDKKAMKRIVALLERIAAGEGITLLESRDIYNANNKHFKGKIEQYLPRLFKGWREAVAHINKHGGGGKAAMAHVLRNLFEPGSTLYYEFGPPVSQPLPSGVQILNQVVPQMVTQATPLIVAPRRQFAYYLPNGTRFVVPTESSQEAASVAEEVIREFNRRAALKHMAVMPGLTNLGDSAIAAAPVYLPLLSDAPAYHSALYQDGASSAERTPCRDESHGAFAKTGGRTAHFYKSNMFTATLTPLRSGLYGQIHLGTMPFKIQINSNVVNSRAKLSLIHECMHGLNELLKLGMNHEQLHLFSGYLLTEVIPAYLALEEEQGR